jgi:hypothetical protein
MGRKKDHHDMLARLPEAVWAALADEARREDRSATAQLVYILRTRYGIPVDAPQVKTATARPRARKQAPRSFGADGARVPGPNTGRGVPRRSR